MSSKKYWAGLVLVIIGGTCVDLSALFLMGEKPSNPALGRALIAWGAVLFVIGVTVVQLVAGPKLREQYRQHLAKSQR